VIINLNLGVQAETDIERARLRAPRDEWGCGNFIVAFA
jgi:hypothetical protein